MSHPTLSLIAEPKLFEKFLQLLQKGVKVKARVGSTVLSFLCDDLGLALNTWTREFRLCS